MSGGVSVPVLHVLDCSPGGEMSVSRRMGRALEDGLRHSVPGLEVRRRDLVREPLPPIETEPDYAGAAKDLMLELTQSNYLLINSPVHNYTVPAVLKVWIDHVLRLDVGFRLTPQGKVGLLQDRPTLVAVSAGGSIFDGEFRQPDFFRPYVLAVLKTIGITNVRFVTIDKTVHRSDAAADAQAIVNEWMKANLGLGVASATTADAT